MLINFRLLTPALLVLTSSANAQQLEDVLVDLNAVSPTDIRDASAPIRDRVFGPKLPEPSAAPDSAGTEKDPADEDGEFIAVPIPMSNPTLGTGLVVGSAYFYPQSAQQALEQPASLTGAAVMASNNGSKALGLFHQAYWSEDAWRFTGGLGVADMRLSLLSPEQDGSTNQVDWRVRGEFLQAQLYRQLAGNWYGGVQLRVVDNNQRIEVSAGPSPQDLNGDDDVRSAGVGALIEYDSRDMPTNPYSGLYWSLDALWNTKTLGSSKDYDAYTTELRYYKQINDDLVLALQAQACNKSGVVPLWDACRVPLRGFAAFNYLGLSSGAAQAEARYQISENWGGAAFVGRGWAGNSYSTLGDDEYVPSFGVGIRYQVLASKRINIRLDFAQSGDDQAFYLSVGEAF